MKTLLFFIMISLSFISCRNANPKAEEDTYLDKEISNRRKILDQYNGNDSLKINTSEIHEQINKLVLLSKDVENLSASVKKANAYFKNLTLTYKINSSGFEMLNTGMHVDEIAFVLKQNELFLLNQLVFKINPDLIIPNTAQ